MARTADSGGFTLIDLMIALAVVAITMSFAVNAYRGQMRRGHRAEAVQALLLVAAEQEKFYLANGRYSERLDAEPGAEPPGLPVASLTPRGHYRLQVESADAVQFRAIAGPAGGHADPLCEQLSIDESGRRQARSREGSDSTARCW